MKDSDQSWIEQRLLERFLRYVRIDTTSDRHSKSTPTTAGQLELARVLVEELEQLSVRDVELDEGGFLFAHLESNLKGSAKQPPEIGFIAHLDTSDAAPGKDVDPRVHEKYDGKIIALKEGVVLDPEEFPELRSYSGQKIITSDGRTLLGADDKAGLAEIMTAVEYLVNHPDLPHGEIGIYFTPDEEQGLSMQSFPIKKISAKYCYTFDGGEEGTIEAECFEGYKADLRFIGKSIHTGVARGKLVNAIEMAATFLGLLPGAESPQATDGRYGFYFPLEITGGIEETTLEIYLRDFEEQEVQRRAAALESMARAVEAVFPRGRVEIKIEKQYANLHRFLRDVQEVLQHLEQAIRETGIEPVYKIIRGGTDGARLSELGVPTPNVFTGGHNFHSRQEWAAVPAMIRAVNTAVNLCRLWAEGGRRG
ncbi:MAG: peptidase T [Spirochaetales bacterium]|nr:peptidase T [Spirochaetales bacterium]